MEALLSLAVETSPNNRNANSLRPPPINQSLVQRLNDAELLESMHSRSRIVRNQEWDPALAKLDTLDLAELVFSLLGLDTVDGETALGVVDETEVLAGLLNRDDVHEAGGEGGVGADLAIDLDKTLHQDGLDLTAVESVLQTKFHQNSQSTFLALLYFNKKKIRRVYLVPVTDEDDQRKAVPELVRTSGSLRGIGSGHLVQEPVRGRTKALLVLLAVNASPLVSNSFPVKISPRTIRFFDVLFANQKFGAHCPQI